VVRSYQIVNAVGKGDRILTAGVTVLAGKLQVPALGEIPPGPFHDEPFNGLGALGISAGHWPVCFAANLGREPLFIHLTTAANESANDGSMNDAQLA